MPGTLLILLIGLALKHYIADYLLQPRWLLAGKGDFTAIGGYVHAGIHVAGSFAVLLAAGIPLSAALPVLAVEFVVHYAIDFIKFRWGGAQHETSPRRFWAEHGLDQLLHQLTYVGMVYFALRAVV